MIPARASFSVASGTAEVTIAELLSGSPRPDRNRLASARSWAWIANRFRVGLGLEPSDSAIVSAEVPGARERLEAAGIVAAERSGRMRASWHVYNTEADVDAALDALVGVRG